MNIASFQTVWSVKVDTRCKRAIEHIRNEFGIPTHAEAVAACIAHVYNQLILDQLDELHRPEAILACPEENSDE